MEDKDSVFTELLNAIPWYKKLYWRIKWRIFGVPDVGVRITDKHESNGKDKKAC